MLCLEVDMKWKKNRCDFILIDQRQRIIKNRQNEREAERERASNIECCE